MNPNFDPSYLGRRNRFPTGAIWLIALGVLFLIGDNGFFRLIRPSLLTGFFLIGFGIFLFVRRMTRTGAGLADDGSPFYRARLIRCLRGPLWIILVGVMMLLNDLHILTWHRSWPLFIILMGIMILLERTAFVPPMQPPPYNQAYGQPYAPPYVPPASSAAPTSEPATGSFLPFTRHDDSDHNPESR